MAIRSKPRFVKAPDVVRGLSEVAKTADWSVDLEARLGPYSADLVVTDPRGLRHIVEVKTGEYLHMGALAHLSAARRAAIEVWPDEDVDTVLVTDATVPPSTRTTAENLGIRVVRVSGRDVAGVSNDILRQLGPVE